MSLRRSPTDIHNLPHLRTFRTELGSNLTPAEATLSTYVKNSKLGRKFRRQHSVGRYILDFYCAFESLAIELDGDGHYSGNALEYDRERRLFLEQFGINVIRFENRMVFEDPDRIIASIQYEFGWRERSLT